MGPTDLRFAAPLLASDRWNPGAVARWILRNVPCFEAGKVPHDWTDAVIKSLDKQLVHEQVIAQAFKLALVHGYDFGDIELLRFAGNVTWQYKQPPLPDGYVTPPSMGKAEPMTEAEIIKVAAYHEEQYVLAVRTNDYRAQARLLKSFKNFLQKVVAGTMLGKKPREAEELNRAKERVQQRAATVNSDAERLERAGVTNPTEQDVRNRIVPMRRPSQGPRRGR